MAEAGVGVQVTGALEGDEPASPGAGERGGPGQGSRRISVLATTMLGNPSGIRGTAEVAGFVRRVCRRVDVGRRDQQRAGRADARTTQSSWITRGNMGSAIEWHL
jgi:hypothetical protein